MVRKLIKAWIFEFRHRHAVKKAQRMADELRRKYLVLVYKGKPVVVSMQDIRRMIRTHRFGKGFTVETARRIALYSAMPCSRT